MNRAEFQLLNPGFVLGLKVLSLDGVELGPVARLDDQNFWIGPGVFFSVAYPMPFEEVARIRQGEVVLRNPIDAYEERLEELGPPHLWTGGFSNQISMGEKGSPVEGISDQASLEQEQPPRPQTRRKFKVI